MTIEEEQPTQPVDRARLRHRAMLHWHLTSNHYPPLPSALIPIAETAIQLALERDWDEPEDWNQPIQLPEGIQFRGRDTITVAEAIETMHLDGFLIGEEDA